MTSTNWIGLTPRGHPQFPARSRHRDLPGADLRGCEEISDFLRRHGTEHAGAGADFGAVGGRAVIVGASSVAFEAARLLLGDGDALASSDVNGARGVRRSAIREVVVLSPSAADHAEYTVGDLSALIGLPATEVVIARGTQESDSRTTPRASAALDAISRIGRRCRSCGADTAGDTATDCGAPSHARTGDRGEPRRSGRWCPVGTKPPCPQRERSDPDSDLPWCRGDDSLRSRADRAAAVTTTRRIGVHRDRRVATSA
jgi:hypothetical protein